METQETPAEEQEQIEAVEETTQEATEAEEVHDTESAMEHPEMKALLASFKDADASTEEEAGEVASEEASDDTEVEAQETGDAGTDAGDPPADDKWVTAKDRILARFIGLTNEELDALGSREELNELATFHESLKGGKKGEQQEATEAAEPEYVDAPILADGTLNVEWFRKHDYDDGQIALAEANAKQAKANKEIVKQFESLQQTLAVEHRNRDINEFHDALDRIDGEFFGKTLNERGEAVQISDRLGARRSQVFAQLDVAAESLSRRLGHAPTMAQKVELASQLAWGTELRDLASRRSEAAKKAQLTKAHNQSKKIRPVGSARTAAPKKEAPTTVEGVVSHPEFKALIAQFDEINGK